MPLFQPLFPITILWTPSAALGPSVSFVMNARQQALGDVSAGFEGAECSKMKDTREGLQDVWRAELLSEQLCRPAGLLPRL